MDFDLRVFAESDTDITINVDDDIDGVEESTEIEEATNRLNTLLDMGAKTDMAVERLLHVRAHILKFGLNKPMLHLVNGGNKLGAAIGMSLPYFESDGDADSVTDSDLEAVDTEVVVESIGERLTAAKDAIVEFFKRLWERVKDFFTKYFGAANRLSKKLEKVNNDIIKNIHKASDAWNDLKVNAYKQADFDKLVKLFEAAVSTVKGVVPDLPSFNGTVPFVANNQYKNLETFTVRETGYKEVVAALKPLGYEIETDTDKVGADGDEYDKITYKVTKSTGDISKETDKLSSLGWSTTDLKRHYPKIKALVDACKKQDTILRKYEKFNKDIGKFVNDAAKKDSDKSKVYYRGLGYYRTAISHITSVIIAMFKEALNLASFYVGLCNRVVIKEN
jgi:hypothetical protein